MHARKQPRRLTLDSQPLPEQMRAPESGADQDGKLVIEFLIVLDVHDEMIAAAKGIEQERSQAFPLAGIDLSRDVQSLFHESSQTEIVLDGIDQHFRRSFHRGLQLFNRIKRADTGSCRFSQVFQIERELAKKGGMIWGCNKSVCGICPCQGKRRQAREEADSKGATRAIFIAGKILVEGFLDITAVSRK